MKGKIKTTLLIAVLLISTITLANVSGLIEHLDMAGGTIEVTSIELTGTPEENFDDEPETLVLDDEVFDAQSKPVTITGTLSDLVLGAGWVDTAYVEIGVRPAATKDDRNSGVYMIFFAHLDGDYFVHLQDYTGHNNIEGFHVAKDLAPFSYTITLTPTGDVGGTADLVLYDKNGDEVERNEGIEYGYSSTWEENIPVEPADEDFSEAYLFYSIIADRRGTAGITYSATVGDVEALIDIETPLVLDSGFYKPGDSVLVTVYDWEKNIDHMAIDIVTIHAESDTDTSGDTITLTETGAGDTGIFEGYIYLIPAPPADRAADEIVVLADDKITVTYVHSLGSKTVHATVDDTAPVVEITDPLDDTFVSGNSVSIEATITEINKDTTVLKIDEDVILVDDVPVEPPYKWDTTTEVGSVPDWPDGSYTLEVVVKDYIGNIGSDLITVKVDNTDPVIANALVSPSTVYPNIATTFVFTADVSDAGSGVDTVKIDLGAISGGPAVPMLDDGEDSDETADDGIYTTSYESIGLPESEPADPYVVTITATDKAENLFLTEEPDEIITIVSSTDLVPPVISDESITYPLGVVSARPGDKIVISATITDDDAMGLVTVSDALLVEPKIVDVPMLDNGKIDDEVADDGIYTATIPILGAYLPDTYELTITAEDDKGNEATEIVLLEVTTKLTGYYVDLEVGWNLFSLPLIPDDSSVEAVLDDVLENVEIVWGYKDDAWSSYLPAVPEFSTLTDMVDGEGYWVKMTVADTETVSGVELPKPPALPPVYSVYEGWNLIGFKAVDSMDATQKGKYFATIPADVRDSSVCYGWDASIQEYEMVYLAGAQLLDFDPGQGYWLYLTEDANIAPPTD